MFHICIGIPLTKEVKIISNVKTKRLLCFSYRLQSLNIIPLDKLKWVYLILTLVSIYEIFLFFSEIEENICGIFRLIIVKRIKRSSVATKRVILIRDFHIYVRYYSVCKKTCIVWSLWKKKDTRKHFLGCIHAMKLCTKINITSNY